METNMAHVWLARLTSRPAARLTLAVIVLITVSPSPVDAYVDFGLGSYAFQLLIAWALAIAFVLRTYWTRIVAFLRRLFGR
jgi:hypothetical protein